MTIYTPRILITGKPNVGKTTIIQKVLKELPVTYGGFYTEEIREYGARVGFRLRTIDGQEGILAHVRSESPHRVGKYGVEVTAFEDIAVPALERVLREFASRTTGSLSSSLPYDSRGNLSAYGGQKGGPSPIFLVVMDELGRMELFSQKFQAKVLEIFEKPIPILGVLQESQNPFLDAIRAREDVRVIRVTRKNREDVVEGIVGRFKAYLRKLSWRQ